MNEISEVIPKSTIRLSEKVTDLPPRPGPRLTDLVRDGEPRDNMITSESPFGYHDKLTWTFTERQGLVDLDQFLERVITCGQKNKNQEMADQATIMRENLVFIGDRELHQATAAMAQRFVDQAVMGQNVFIFCPGFRSERYVSLLVLEEIDRLTETQSDLRKKIRFSQQEEAVARTCRAVSGDCRIAIPDDFSVTGVRIDISARTMANCLARSGFTSGEINEMVEADLVACNPRLFQEERFILETGAPLRVNTYYEVTNPPKTDEKQYRFNSLLTGSHCSVDYTFESPMDEFVKFLRIHEENAEIPLLSRIVRPYVLENDHYHYRYVNKELQARWDKAVPKYLCSEA